MTKPSINFLATVAAAATLLRSVGATYIISIDGVDVGDATDTDGMVMDAIADSVHSAHANGYSLGLEEGRKEAVAAAGKTGGRRRSAERLEFVERVVRDASGLSAGQSLSLPYDDKQMFVSIAAMDHVVRDSLKDRLVGRWFTIARTFDDAGAANGLEIICRV